MEYKIILRGINSRSDRGVFGFANISLIKDEGKNILFDTGHYGDRHELLEKLSENGLKPEDIDMILLSHLHFDHAINIGFFKNAVIVISKEEFEYAKSCPKKDIYMPAHMEWLLDKLKVKLISGETKITNNITMFPTPGHTPGHYSAMLKIKRQKIVLAGDAIHYISEIINNKLTPAFIFGDASDAMKSMNCILKNADVIIPGHDRVCFVRNGKVSWDEPTKLTIIAR